MRGGCMMWAVMQQLLKECAGQCKSGIQDHVVVMYSNTQGMSTLMQ